MAKENQQQVLAQQVSPVALLLLLLLGLDWGAGYTIARYVTTHGVSPLAYAFWQSLGPAIVLSGLALVFLGGVPSRYLRFYAVCGLLGIAIPNSIMYFAAPHLPAGILAVIANTVPMMTYVFALAHGQEQFSWRRFAAVFVALFGLTMLINPVFAMQSTEAPWVLLSLITPMCFALCAVYSARNRPAAAHALALPAGMLIASSVFLLPVMLLSKQVHTLTWPLSFVDQLILLEIALSSLGTVLFFQLIRLAGPVFYSFVSGVVAVTGLFWGWLIFNESLTRLKMSAVAVILLAIVMVSRTAQAK